MGTNSIRRVQTGRMLWQSISKRLESYLDVDAVLPISSKLKPTEN